MRDDQRKRVRVLRPDVDEMDLEPVDVRDELRKRVQPRLRLSPVVIGRPVLASFCMVASGTPCVASATVSRSGHRVAATRRRSSSMASCGI